MIQLILKQLRHDKANTVITVFALAASIAVILILQGFEQGQYEQLNRIVLNRGSDLVALQPRVTNFIATRSVLPQMVREKIENVPGVSQVHPLTTLPIIYQNHGMLTPVYVIVFDSSGGPAELLRGTSETRGHIIVIDKTLAKKYRLNIGDVFRIADFDFVISGITSEAAFMMPFAFINYDGLIDLFFQSEIAPDLSTFPLLSFLLIDVDSSYSVVEVQQRLENQVPEIDVFTPSQLAANDISLGKGFFKPILGLLTAVGFLLGLLLICLLMFSSTHRNQRNFAIMRALGFHRFSLLHYTVFLACLLLAMGFTCSLLLAAGIASLIEAERPVYYFAVFQWSVLLRVGGMVLVFALLGASLPYFRLHKIDPATALQNTAG